MIVYTKPTGPSAGKCMPGAVALRQTMEFFDGNVLAFNGCYVNRPPRGFTSGYSTHAEGRALDWNRQMVNGLADPNPIPEGSPADIAIKKWMWIFVATADQAVNLGVQRFVYKNAEWIVNRGTQYRSKLYKLTRDHQQHIHIELSRHAAQNLTGEQIRIALFGR